MKILITNEGNSRTANFFIRAGYQRAFQAAGHNAHIHELGTKPLFDVFDEFEPELLMTQTYNVDKAMVKCIEERPQMKVIMKASDWGLIQDKIDLQEYPILVANQKEIDFIFRLRENTGKPDFVHGHYHPNRIFETHGFWEGLPGLPEVIGLMSAADIFSFTNGKKRDSFTSDITFIGGYWGYKAKTLDKYILRLCNADRPYKVKIFGNQSWGIPQFCGYISDDLVKDVLASSTICPNVSELHSEIFGYDIIERLFKLGSNKCFCISDYVESAAKDVFTNNEIVFAKTPEEFEGLIVHYLKCPDERLPYIERYYNKVMGSETYFHRCSTIFKELKMDWEADNMLKAYEQIREEL